MENTSNKNLVAALNKLQNITVLLLCGFVLHAGILADEGYIYIRKDGTTFIEDMILPPDPGYSLLTINRSAMAAPSLRLHLKQPTQITIESYPVRHRYNEMQKSDYDTLISILSETHEIDPSLIKAIVRVESAFNAYAVSHAGAEGLMQLMPDTAKRYGIKDSFDPKENIKGGIMYLKYLFSLFDHNLNLVLAAYNAGEGAVLKFDGIPPYQETIDYVKKVTYFHKMYSS